MLFPINVAAQETGGSGLFQFKVFLKTWSIIIQVKASISSMCPHTCELCPNLPLLLRKSQQYVAALQR